MKYSTKYNLENTPPNSDDFFSFSKQHIKQFNINEELNNIDKKNSNNLPSDLLNNIDYISPIPRKKQNRKISDVIFTEEVNETSEEFEEKKDNDFSLSDQKETNYKFIFFNKKENNEILYKKYSNKTLSDIHFNNLYQKDNSINNINNSLLTSNNTFGKNFVLKLLLNNDENDNKNFKLNKSMNLNVDNNKSVNRNMQLNNNTKNNISQNNESQISDSLNFNLNPNIFFSTLNNKTKLKTNNEGSENSNSIIDSPSINNINQNICILKDILNSVDENKNNISNSSNEEPYKKLLLNTDSTPFIPKSCKNYLTNENIPFEDNQQTENKYSENSNGPKTIKDMLMDLHNNKFNNETEKTNNYDINQNFYYKNTYIINNDNNINCELDPKDYLIEMFGRKGWICKKCDNFNFETRNKCNRCFYAKEPKTIEEINKLKKEREEKKKNKVKNTGKRSDWICLNCQNLNYGFRRICNRCHIERQEDFPTVKINSYKLK